VCSLEFDREGANWQLSATGSAVLATLADPTRWKANVVRIPVNQQWFLEDEAYVLRVERLLDEANDRGLYAILDVQWEVGRALEPYHLNILELPTFGEGNTTEAFWLKASGRWQNRTNLLYDLINEPHGYGAETTAQAMQSLVNGIRQRTPDAVIIIGGPDWAHSVDNYRVQPLEGGQLVYSAHQYLPYDPPSAFPDRFLRAAETLPVLLGEFLADEKNPDYVKALVEAAEGSNVVGWLPWAVGCGFDINDDQTREPTSFLARAMRELNP
jgi:endoglucanase